MIITNVFEKQYDNGVKCVLEKSIWRVHLSNLWCTFAQAIFVFGVCRSRWVDCFGCSMVRFVGSLPSVMRYPPSFDVLLYHSKVSVREKICHIFQDCRNLHITSTIQTGRYSSESDIYQPICQPIYQPICCPICHAVLITLLPQHHYSATTTLLPCYGNIVVPLRQHHCPATAISFCCCLTRWVDCFRS